MLVLLISFVVCCSLATQATTRKDILHGASHLNGRDFGKLIKRVDRAWLDSNVLVAAVEGNNAETCKLLLNDVDYDQTNYNWAISVACKKGRLEALDALLSYQQQFDDYSALKICTENDQVTCLKRLLQDFRVQPTHDNLMVAIHSANYQAIGLLIEAGLDVNDQDGLAARAALVNGDIKTFQLLQTQYGAVVDVQFCKMTFPLLGFCFAGPKCLLPILHLIEHVQARRLNVPLEVVLEALNDGLTYLALDSTAEVEGVDRFKAKVAWFCQVLPKKVKAISTKMGLNFLLDSCI